MKDRESIIKTLAILAVALLMISGRTYAQEPMTRSYDVNTGSPPARITDISWIAGTWRGEAMGGSIEEVWSAPMAGSMMASFKFVDGNEVKFYELEVITEEEGTLVLRLKHFHANMKGWEEKDETVDFRLVKISADKAYFDGLTFEKIGNNEMRVYVVIGDDSKKEEVSFNYLRAAD